jgi:hypothetical protein
VLLYQKHDKIKKNHEARSRINKRLEDETRKNDTKIIIKRMKVKKNKKKIKGHKKIKLDGQVEKKTLIKGKKNQKNED